MTTIDYTGLSPTLRHYVSASTDASTVTVDVPSRFYHDHVGRDLPGGTIVKELARTTRVELDRDAFDDLIGDADLYVEIGEDLDRSEQGLVTSARATLRLLSGTPRPAAVAGAR